MDQKLLDALNNMSEALEQIASALRSSEGRKEGDESATAAALKGGDFVTQIKEINVGVKQLQKDTKKILKNQETLIRLSKKNKKSEFESIGGDKKKESDLKKGIGTILLIAIAVLAIGMAFKLVGGINFLSVIGLSLALLILSYAFEKIAKINVSLKQAAITSASMVMMALAVTLSSHILKKITPIGFAQTLTMIMLGLGFSLLSPAIEKIITAFGRMGWGGLIRATIGLVMILPAIALGLTISSHILQRIAPIGLRQAISAIFVAGVFAVVSYGMKNMLQAFGGVSLLSLGKALLFLPLIMPAIAKGIAMASKELNKTQPISLASAWGAIMVALVFTVISFGLKNIVSAMGKVDAKSVVLVPLLLPLIALAIALSSKYLRKVQPISFIQFITSVAIAIVFVVIGFAIKLIGKSMEGMSWGTVLKIPALFTLVSLAIMLSSRFLSKTTAPPIAETIRIALFGIGLALVVAAMMIPYVIISKFKIGLDEIAKGTVAIIAISAAIMVSSHIIGMGNYGKYPSIGWSLNAGAAILIFGLAVLGIGMAIALTAGLGLAAIAMGGVAVVIVAGAIAAASHILVKGNYGKYPPIQWALSVTPLMIAFSAGMMILGILPKMIVRDGAWAIKEVAKSIVVTDKEVSKGKYAKYPPIGWALTVSALMAGYSVGMAALGILPKFIIRDGVAALKEVAKSIVTTDTEVAKGKYTKYPPLGWSVTVSALMLGYAAGMTALGILPKMIVRDGVWALKHVAKSILSTDRIVARGKYDKYPSLGWSVTVSALMLGYAVGMTALGILPKMIVRDGTWAIKSVAKSILTVERIISRGKYKNFPSIEWAGTVGLLMVAWSTGVTLLGLLPKMIVRDGAWAIKTIAQSIVSTGYIFTKAAGVFKAGPTKEWAEGVSLAIGAFGEVYSLMLKAGAINAIFGGGIKPSDFGVAIKTISSGIVDAARFFADPKNSGVWKPGPTKEWANGIGTAIAAFAPVYAMLLKNAPGFLSSGGGVGPKEFAKAVVTVSKGIIAAADVFGKNSSKFDEGKYPSKNWGQGVGAALKAFAPVFKALSEDTGLLTSGEEVISNMIKGIVGIARAIVSVASKFEKSGLKWNSSPDKKWGYNISLAIKSYVKLSSDVADVALDTLYLPKQVAMHLVSMAKLISANSEYFEKARIDPKFMQNVGYSIRKFADLLSYVNIKVGLFSDITLVSKMAAGMHRVAQIFSKPISKGMPALTGWMYVGQIQRIASFWVEDLKDSTRKFMATLKMVDKMAKGISNYSIVEKMATHMSKTAVVIAKNASAFRTKMNPDFMSALYKNFVFYIKMVDKLRDSEGVGDMISKAFGGDPVINMANGMIALAKAYDRLSSSLTKMGKAMEAFNDKKIHQLERISRIRPHGNPGLLANIGTAIGNTIGNAMAMAAPPSVQATPSKSNQEKKGDIFPKGRYGNIAKQQDMIIDLLMQLNEKLSAGSNIDSATIKFLTDKESAKM